jgi:hypothetical protein
VLVLLPHIQWCLQVLFLQDDEYPESLVIIAMGLGCMTWVQFLVGARYFTECHIIKISSGVHPASYPVGTGRAFSPGVNQPEREADHSPSPVVEVENGGSPYVLMA